MNNKFRLPDREPFGELAGDYPDWFGLAGGKEIEFQKTGEPGFSLRAEGGKIALAYHDTSSLFRALGMLITPVNKLIDFSQGYAEALVKFDMVNDYLKIPPEMVDRQNAKKIDALKGEVEVRNVVFGFEPEKKLLKTHRSSIREPVSGADYAALVAAQSRAIAKLSQEIAEAIQGAGKN